MIRRGQLHLVRHGQTTWNTAGRLQGRTMYVPLDDVGRGQADAVAAQLAELPVAAVVSSDQVRALQTAEPIAAAHCLPVIPEPALREQSFGAWEGGSIEAYSAALGADPDWAAPDGETADSVRDRVGAFLEVLLADRPGGDIVLVSHRETIRALLAVLADRPTADFPREGTLNGTVRSVWMPL